jgi:hypothetical protein
MVLWLWFRMHPEEWFFPGQTEAYIPIQAKTDLAAASINSTSYFQNISPKKMSLLDTVVLTHGAEPFLRIHQLGSPSRTSQHFMEPEGSIPCSQEPSNGPYSEPYQSSPHHPILSKIHFDIIHPPTSWSFQWTLSYKNSCSPPFVSLHPLWSKYSPQHPVLKHPQSVFLP